MLTAALAALSLSASAADRPRLFGAAVPARSAATATANPAAVRERLAAPDFTLIPDLAAKTNDLSDGPWFTLDLFDNLALDAQVMRVERTESGGIAIIARLADAELGSAVLVQNGKVLTGSVTFPGGSYSILPQADGTVSIAKVAPHLLPPDGEPRMVKGAAPLAADLAAGDAPADTGKLIDVIVFWTPAAQTAAGGLAQIQNNIDTAITLTNNAYRNGGIAQRIRLVSKQAVTYTETGPDAFGNALDAITNGTIPGTAAARNTFGADEVVLVINDPAYCGIAWLPSTISSANAGQGFAIVGGGSCLTSNFSFGHELGHNMGAHHDPYVAPGPGAFAYSHGMSKIGASSATSWRTIMAYNNECAATVGGCTRLQYFSNPMVNYADGFAMGDGPARNNALTLNKSANAVSNYRARTVPIAASFSDVPLTDPSFGYVEFMYQGGYTGGCASGPLRFCPADPITRGQMAVFLERTKRGANFTRAATGTVFTDVSVSTPFAGFIEQLSADGITSGCAAGPMFCPAANVSRAAMAKFLLKAKCGAAYVPNTPASSPFSDVAASDPFLPWISKLYNLGITGGCATSPLRYCPTANVTRVEMATFIYRTFPYGTPSDVCTP
jgi:hypothetical protein